MVALILGKPEQDHLLGYQWRFLEIDIQISHGSRSHLEEGERWTCPQNVQRLPQVQPGQGDPGHPVEWKHSHLAAVSGIWHLADQPLVSD